MIEIDSIGRAVESNGDKTVVALTRTYDAEIADVWDALTDPERLSRWFLPIEGDLRVGGRYQLKGQAGGEILSCEPPHRFLVTWVFPPEPAENNISEVEVRLREDGDKTVLELRHEAAVDPQMWNQFGPGAVGVGWDLCLLGLAMHLEHGGGVVNAEAFERSPEAREFITASSDAWGVANAKFGTPPGEVAAQVAATTAFYAPPPRESAPRESAPQG
jgi:uncharacterized protein YndB with AHSA1/START domain